VPPTTTTTTTVPPTTTTTTTEAPNSAPVAVDDDASGNPGSTIVIKVLDNDYDADGDLLTISGYDPSGSTSSGTLTCTNVCRFDSDPAWDGSPFVFIYTIEDGRGGIAMATVEVTGA
jgi:hypothetical protein